MEDWKELGIMEYYWKNSFKLLLKRNREFRFLKCRGKVLQTRAPWKAKLVRPNSNLGVGKFQWAPIVSSVNDVLLAEVLSSSGLLGTDTFPVLEGNGDDRCPPYGVGWSCVLQVLPARPEQGGHPEHDGAVRIDRQVCRAANKWKVLCTLSTKDAT